MARHLISGGSPVLVGAAVILVATLSSAASATARSVSAFDGATLTVGAGGLGASDVTFDLELDGGPGTDFGAAARVDLTIPVGFRMNLGLRPDATVGFMLGAVTSADGKSGGTFVSSQIVVDNPARYASDPAAQACAPGDHTAVWRASPKILGRPVELPIAVDAISTAAGTAYAVHFCPLDRPSAAYPAGLAMTSALIDLSNSVSAPAGAGTYRVSALVTPATPGTLAPDASTAFELRAALRLPERLTLQARHEPTQHRAMLAGSYVSGGSPQAGVPIRIRSTSGPADTFGTTTTVTTKADGSFSLRRPIAQTTTYTADVPDRTLKCADASTAPGGCKSETVAGSSSSASAFLALPGKTEPTLQMTLRDRNTAQRSVPVPADVPPARAVGAPPPPCQAFAHDLHRLHAHGYASSAALVSADGRTMFYGTAWVFARKDDASSYFQAVARVAAGRCEGKRVAADWGEHANVTVRDLPLSRVGNESRAYRARVVDRESGTATVDVLFARVGRTVITLHMIEAGTRENEQERFLLRVLAARAGQGS